MAEFKVDTLELTITNSTTAESQQLLRRHPLREHLVLRDSQLLQRELSTYSFGNLKSLTLDNVTFHCDCMRTDNAQQFLPLILAQSSQLTDLTWRKVQAAFDCTSGGFDPPFNSFLKRIFLAGAECNLVPKDVCTSLAGQHRLEALVVSDKLFEVNAFNRFKQYKKHWQWAKWLGLIDSLALTELCIGNLAEDDQSGDTFSSVKDVVVNLSALRLAIVEGLTIDITALNAITADSTTLRVLVIFGSFGGSAQKAIKDDDLVLSKRSKRSQNGRFQSSLMSIFGGPFAAKIAIADSTADAHKIYRLANPNVRHFLGSHEEGKKICETYWSAMQLSRYWS